MAVVRDSISRAAASGARAPLGRAACSVLSLHGGPVRHDLRRGGERIADDALAEGLGRAQRASRRSPHCARYARRWRPASRCQPRVGHRRSCSTSSCRSVTRSSNDPLRRDESLVLGQTLGARGTTRVRDDRSEMPSPPGVDKSPRSRRAPSPQSHPSPGLSITIGNEHGDPRFENFTIVTSAYRAGSLTA